MAVKRRARSSNQRMEFPGGRIRLDTYGSEAENGVSIWFDSQLMMATMTRGKHGTLIRLVPDGAAIPERDDRPGGKRPGRTP